MNEINTAGRWRKIKGSLIGTERRKQGKGRRCVGFQERERGSSGGAKNKMLPVGPLFVLSGVTLTEDTNLS